MALRTIAFLASVLVLAWQGALAGRHLWRETAAVSIEARRRAITATPSERIALAIGTYKPLHDAIARHAPEDATLVFFFRLEQGGFDAYWNLVTLLYPRRFVPITEPPTPELLALLARLDLGRWQGAIYVVDLESGFDLPMRSALQDVESGPGFNLWRLR